MLELLRIRSLVTLLGLLLIAFALAGLVHSIHDREVQANEGSPPGGIWAAVDGFTALYWALAGGMVCMGSMLWHARTANPQWLQIVAGSFRLLGGLLLTLLIFLMISVWQQQRSREIKVERDKQVAAENAAKEAERTATQLRTIEQDKLAEQERRSKKYRDNTDDAEAMAMTFTQNAANPAATLSLLDTAAVKLADSELSSLGLAQVLYTTYCSNADPTVKERAQKILFPTLSQPFTIKSYSFSEEILYLAAASTDHPGGAPRISVTDSPYNEYLSLIIQHAKASSLSSRAEDLVNKASKDSLSKPGLKAVDILQATASTDLATTRQEAIKKFSSYLSSSSPENSTESFQKVFNQIPQAVAARIAPRVFMHIPKKEWRPEVTGWRAKVQDSGYIFPGIELVSGSPVNTEVRYFSTGSKSEAENIVNLLKNVGVTDAISSYTRPSAEDLRQRGGIENHFEVWIGTGTAIPSAKR